MRPIASHCRGKKNAKTIDKYGEIRCYIRDPDGYIIDVDHRASRFQVAKK